MSIDTYIDEHGDEVTSTTFSASRKPITLTAKWWMKPICWITRKPTTRTIYR